MKNYKNFLVFLLIIVFTFTSACNKSDDENHSDGIKNIIIMIGDGMGMNQEEAARIYAQRPLSWDSMDFKGEMVTHSLTGVTDSAAAATAMSTGVKVYNDVVQKDQTGNNLKGIMNYAQDLNKKTGIVVSETLAGATPAGFSARSMSRHNTNEIITSQIYSGIDLFIGEGTDTYLPYKNIMEEEGYTFISNKNAILNTGGKFFAALPFINPEQSKNQYSAELSDLTSMAINILSKEKNGFVLMVEGSKIDHMCHARLIDQTIYETLAFEKAVNVVLEWAKSRNDTLVIVTADHETGGLELLEGVNADNILNGEFISWIPEPAVAPHTLANVNYYISGDLNSFMKSLIDITDIFKIMRYYL